MAVKWGIISTAKINERVLPEVRESSEVDLVAVASRSQDASVTGVAASSSSLPAARSPRWRSPDTSSLTRSRSS